jgi:hypothetical protein
VPRARKPSRPRGTNLAIADVHVLDRALGAFYEVKDTGLLESYTTLALRRVRHQPSPRHRPAAHVTDAVSFA